MIIGLDFGTTNSIISYWDELTGRVEVFSYGNDKYIPSAVVYQDGELMEIGEEALTYWRSNQQQTSIYRFFKTLLSDGEVEKLSQNGSLPKTPREVTRDYLEYFLLKNDKSFVKSQEKPISQIVVSVPELWQKKGIANKGASKLEAILKHDLGLPLKQLVSEPVAAVAYYIWKSNLKNGEKKKVLVCDVGGGTFDVCYCSATKDSVEVELFEGNDDNRAGVYNLKQILRNAYQRKKIPIDENSFQFKSDIWDLDKNIQLDANTKRLARAYSHYQKDPKRNDGAVFNIQRGEIFCSDVFEAFSKIREGIYQVLDRMAERTGSKSSLEFDQLLLVGGFSRYFLVREAILGYFSLSDEDPKVKIVNRDSSLYAIAHGAALVASNQVEIKEYYPHSIFYIGSNKNGKRVEIPILTAGDPIIPNQPKFADKKVRINGQEFELEGYVLLGGASKEKESFKKHIRIPFKLDYSSHYQIGIIINRSNLAKFVIKKHGENQEYYEIDLDELFDRGIYVVNS